MEDELKQGLYETLLTDRLVAVLSQLPGDSTVERQAPDPEFAVRGFVAQFSDLLGDVLAKAQTNDERVAICNHLIQILRQYGDLGKGAEFAAPVEQLLAVLPSVAELVESPRHVRPMTPLSLNRLMVNGTQEPRLQHEIARELESADTVDLLCAFVRFAGVSLLREPLRRLVERGRPLRVITTTYMGATERKAVDLLVDLGAEVKIAYDQQTTRLHAKAWMFGRESGFTTAYVGSSNLSRSALLDGLEWNVRLSVRESPAVFETFRASFASYWADAYFETYLPDRDRDRLDEALNSEGGEFPPPRPIVLFDLHPRPFQVEILQRLEVERERHGRWRNLVVAATGTGKTVVAAFDYRRLREQLGDLSLLFVAHRREILEQSLTTFRTVLRDANFGELFVAGLRPVDGNHVFASIQSLARVDLDSVPPDRFDMVIVDEFHHAAAPTYARLLSYLEPRILLGLTATPERTDGQDVTTWFDGRFATELRLWDALAQQLLCPLHYFGLSDGTDLKQVEWKRGGYNLAELDGLYTGNDRRVQLVLDRIHDYVARPESMRALGFCVSVAHAEYMTKRFSDAGYRAACITGSTPEDERERALVGLERGEFQVVFAVDVLNEGVDVPHVDTILMLRPTESATLFLQQLGRGLRLARGKSHLTVLDFIGQQHREFRFDLRFRALTGGSRRDLERDVEEGFPFLPVGCSLELDRVAQDIVLTNVRSAIRGSRRAVVDEIRRLDACTLGEFLDHTGFELADVYRGGTSWSALRRTAAKPVESAGPDESTLARAVGRMLHVDDPERLAALRRFVEASPDLDLDQLSERERRLLAMFRFSLWGVRSAVSLVESQRRLRAHPAIGSELLELFDVLDDQAKYVARPLGSLPEVPLSVHSRYSREEILAALGRLDPEKPFSLQTGVLFDEDYQTDSFFVTVHKSERHHSATTLYRDYPLSASLFHWESQNTTAESSKVGQRYINHVRSGTNVFLFVRERRAAEHGPTMPYLFLGPATYVSHEGEKPMAIIWRLRDPMPEEFLSETELVARGA